MRKNNHQEQLDLHIIDRIDSRSDFTMDPEEARAKAASRKASRMASRERGEEEVVPVEDLGGNLF